MRRSRDHSGRMLVAGGMVWSLMACGGQSAPDSRGLNFAGTSSSGTGGSAGAQTGSSAGTGTGGTSDGGASGSGGILGCGRVVNDVPLIAPVISSNAPPVPAGGTPVSGTYVLSSLTYYLSGMPCMPPAVRTSAVFNLYAASATNGAIEENTNQTTSISTIKDSRDALDYTVDGTALALKYDCTGTLSAFSRNAQTPMAFTATGREIRAFGPNGSCGVSVSVFTRR